MEPTRWESLDPAEPGLAAARLALHHALQPVAAVGQSLAPKAADDGQQALTLGEGGLWLGAPVAGGAARAGLDPVALRLCLCDGGGLPLASLPLAGRTVADGLQFLEAELGRRGLPGGLSLPRHPADFPSHPLGDGARFEAGGAAARAALARILAGTAELLRGLAAPAAEPRLWPHHFDLAVSRAAGALAFGLGLSAGDGAAGLPYWYATPWPNPPRDALPPLAAGGRWRETGWFGAELPLEAIAASGLAPPVAVLAFLRSALAAAVPRPPREERPIRARRFR